MNNFRSTILFLFEREKKNRQINTRMIRGADAGMQNRIFVDIENEDGASQWQQHVVRYCNAVSWCMCHRMYPTFIKPATLIAISVSQWCASSGNSIFWLCVWNTRSPFDFFKENYQKQLHNFMRDHQTAHWWSISCVCWVFVCNNLLMNVPFSSLLSFFFPSAIGNI